MRSLSFPISNEWIRRTTQLSPSIDIVIVNWNAGGQLRDCLESIVSADRYDAILERVVVVDNASHDGSADGLDDIGLPLELIRNSTNRGFAAACNEGTRGSTSDYALFLNPDTRLFGPSLTRPLQFMEQPENRRVGICGVKLVDEEGVVVLSCTRFPTPRILLARLLGLSHLFPAWFRSHEMLEWDHSESRKVDHVKGAFYLIRRPVFESLGGFDEDYFLYLEDLDLSLRAPGRLVLLLPGRCTSLPPGWGNLRSGKGSTVVLLHEEPHSLRIQAFQRIRSPGSDAGNPDHRAGRTPGLACGSGLSPGLA